MAERQAERQRLGLERVGAAAAGAGRREDMNDLLAARMEHLQGALGKRRLPDKRDAHRLMNLHATSRTRPALAQPTKSAIGWHAPARRASCVRAQRLWVGARGHSRCIGGAKSG